MGRSRHPEWSGDYQEMIRLRGSHHRAGEVPSTSGDAMAKETSAKAPSGQHVVSARGPKNARRSAGLTPICRFGAGDRIRTGDPLLGKHAGGGSLYLQADRYAGVFREFRDDLGAVRMLGSPGSLPWDHEPEF